MLCALYYVFQGERIPIFLQFLAIIFLASKQKPNTELLTNTVFGWSSNWWTDSDVMRTPVAIRNRSDVSVII